jgi:predicted transcriptional regulator
MSVILGELEQKVMDIMWAREDSLKPAEVLESLNSDLAYTTVMTILKRLSDKGLLLQCSYYKKTVCKKQTI